MTSVRSGSLSIQFLTARLNLWLAQPSNSTRIVRAKHWLTLQLSPTRQIMYWQLRSNLLKTLLICCKWSTAVMPWIPSANRGFIDNITWTGKSLPLLAVSVTDADRAIKCSVPSVHLSKTSTNLLGSRSLISCCKTLNKASMLWRRVFVDTGFNLVILRVNGQSTNPTGRFFMITNSIHSNISLSVLLILRTNPFSAFSCRALLYTVQKSSPTQVRRWLSRLVHPPFLDLHYCNSCTSKTGDLFHWRNSDKSVRSRVAWWFGWLKTHHQRIRVSYEHNKNGLNEILL